MFSGILPLPESLVKTSKAEATAVVCYVLNQSHALTHALLSLSDFLFCTYIVLYILYMMTSVGSERTRGTRDKMQISTTQPIQQQKQVVQVRATV